MALRHGDVGHSAVKHAGIDVEVFGQAADVVSCQLAFAVPHVGERGVGDARGGGDLELGLTAIGQQTVEHRRVRGRLHRMRPFFVGFDEVAEHVQIVGLTFIELRPVEQFVDEGNRLIQLAVIPNGSQGETMNERQITVGRRSTSPFRG